MSHIPATDPPQFGKGAVQSPPDARNLVITEKHLASAVTLPASFILGNRPPITNQGATPECVAYSSASEQNWQDRVEHGRFFNFDEHQHFLQIGGTSSGASATASLQRMRDYGMPEQDATPSPALHKIDGYALVEPSIQAVKQAIIVTGGVLGTGPWWPNWEHPIGEKAVLPPPSGGASGHQVWYVGWDEFGIIGQQSWGTAWGDRGLFRMGWPYFIQGMWQISTTLDDRTLSLVAKGVIKERATYIRRPKLVIGDNAPKLGPKSIWGQARNAGIWRRSTDSIVATPWDKPFRYLGKRNGVRHSEGPRGETWVLLGIAGTEVALPAPDVRLVNV